MNRVHCLFLALSVAMLWGTSPLGAAVVFLEDFEGPPAPPGEINSLGWVPAVGGGANSIGYGLGDAVDGLLTNVAQAPAQNSKASKLVGAGFFSAPFVLTFDMFLTGVYDTAATAGEGMVGIDDGSASYLNALLVGPNANPANAGYPNGAGGWVLWDGLDGAERVNITTGGIPGVGPQFKGIGSGRVQVQMTVDPNPGVATVSVDIFDRDTMSSINPTWVKTLTPNELSDLADVDSVMMTWADAHPGDLREVDNIQLDSSFFPATQWQWVANNIGHWNSTANWSAVSGVGPLPNGGEHTAIFGSNITSPTLVAVNSPAVANRIEFNSAQTYVIGGSSNVSLDPSTAPADPTIEVFSGDHEFQVEVSIEADTDVTVAGGASLTFNNTLHLNGFELDVVSGTVNINNTVTGGGLISSSAVLAGGGTIDGDLNNTPAGIIEVEILAAGASGLTITGTAILDGLLDVTGGISPSPGEVFTVLTAGSIVDSGLELTPAADAIYDMTINPTTVVLTVSSSAAAAVPEPSTLLLMLLGAVGLRFRPAPAEGNPRQPSV